ncbi:MAG TPA: hypothetical protein VGL77_02710 [Armatimonadota bacterium]|jgi:hypothetical protein
MDDVWYERPDVRAQLITFGRGMQGRDPFDVILEPDPLKCHSGSCSFAAHTIIVNPTLFAVPAKTQYILTKGLLVHEAGHRRYTTPLYLPPVTWEIANVLEDERVEQKMCEEFIGVRWLITTLATQFYKDSRLIDPTSDSLNEVVAYFLQLRWAQRIGQPVKGELSPFNQQLWEVVKPLVFDAWQADTTAAVNRIAEDITEILGFHRHASNNNL